MLWVTGVPSYFFSLVYIYYILYFTVIFDNILVLFPKILPLWVLVLHYSLTICPNQSMPQRNRSSWHNIFTKSVVNFITANICTIDIKKLRVYICIQAHNAHEDGHDKLLIITKNGGRRMKNPKMTVPQEQLTFYCMLIQYGTTKSRSSPWYRNQCHYCHQKLKNNCIYVHIWL
jgi:hypothetical protein